MSPGSLVKWCRRFWEFPLQRLMRNMTVPCCCSKTWAAVWKPARGNTQCVLAGQSLKGLNKDYSVLLKYAALSQLLSVKVNSQIYRLISTLWFWKRSFWAGQFILIIQSYHPHVHYPTKIRTRQLFSPQFISVSFKTKCKIHFKHIPPTRCLINSGMSLSANP